MNKKFYVYVLLDPRKPGKYEYGFGESRVEFDYEPFYVGKGSGNRIYESCRVRSAGNSKSHKNNLLRKLRNLGLRPVALKYVELSQEDVAYAVEAELVATIGKYIDSRGPLTNNADGGVGGSSGCAVSEETKRKISEKQRGVPRKPHTEESKALISAAQKHIVRTDAWKQKIGDAHRGKTLTEEHKQAVSEYQCARARTKEENFYMRVCKYRYVYEIIDPEGFKTRTFTLKDYANPRNLHATNLVRTFETGVPYRGYLVTLKERLPKRWVHTQYYQDYLQLGNVDIFCPEGINAT